MAKILSAENVIDRIASGEVIVIYEGLVLKLDKWVQFHPGGDKAIYHMVGRDCSDEMNAYHSEETQKIFKRFKIGEINHQWENLLPPIQGGLYKKLGRLAGELAGAPHGKVVPGIPQNVVVTPDLAVLKRKVIRDPEDVLDNFEHDNVERDLQNFPELDYVTQYGLSHQYNLLHQKVIDADLYQCTYWGYFKEACRIVSLLLWSAVFFKANHLFLSAVLLGASWHQMTFIVHDAAHISITHNYQFDSWISMTIASFCGGLSSGWWKNNHNVHHLVTNDPVHDPDIQHLPFFAVSVQLFKNVYSTYYEKYLYFDPAARFLITVQNYLYYPILSFGRFNLYRLSWTHLLLGEGPKKGKAAWFRYYELLGLCVFNYWYFYLLIYRSIPTGGQRFQYIMVSHICTMLVHVQIVLSHFAMSTSDLGVSESFPQKQLRTTMDVDCPEWFDFFHGGLQFQAIHHLFPRMPRHNFRKAQPYVIEFCKQVGIQYTIFGFTKGNAKVLSRLEQIARQAEILAECTKNLRN